MKLDEATPKLDHGANEFLSEGLSEWDPTLDRRDFLKLSSAAIALAGLSACVKPPIEKMFPYVSQPENLVPGESQFFATQFSIGGLANGLLIETHEGRPTRVDGNPMHPANFGAASAIHQALVLSLYDPDRIREVSYQGKKSNLNDFQMSLTNELKKLHGHEGLGFAILAEVSSSEVCEGQREALARQFPKMMWVDYDPLVSGNCEEATRVIFGEAYTPVYDFKTATLVVSIDSDFISSPRSPLVYAKDFAENESTKLFAIESSATLTGAKAHRRLALPPSKLTDFCRLLGANLFQGKKPFVNLSIEETEFLQNLVASVQNNTGPVLFIAHDNQTVEVHALCQLLNLHYAQKSIRYLKPAPRSHDFGLKGLNQLAEEIQNGKIQALLILGGNPAYGTPASLNFSSALKKVPFVAHLSGYENETSTFASWLIPEAHTLESFSDARAFDGTLSFGQPMIAPMYAGICTSELLHFILTGESKTGLEILNSHYGKKWGIGFQAKIKSALKTGFHSETERASANPPAKIAFSKLAAKWKYSAQSTSDSPSLANTIELCFREDRKIDDGKFANHPWLQEFPDPLTRLTWGNAILIHPDNAQALAIQTGDVLELENAFGKISGPALIDHLQARNSVTLPFGYGQTKLGPAARDQGFNAYCIWDGNFSGSATIRKTSAHEELAITQGHHSMEGRDLVRKIASTEKASKLSEAPSLYEKTPITDGEYAWAMTIDLDRCTGCGACVLACQGENNIPVVGKSAVKMGREMHWIRVDRYFETDKTAGENTLTHFQPVPCMHCEKAPCEPVCPTGATLHGNGGLNQMVYNRCVGTRYCSNNCPYKVRRFNFLTYNDKNSKLDARSHNPNVSVRTRGVMEKCTYCVQRISAGRIESARSKKPIADGMVKTACQTTCPSSAIEFGNINDPNSRVSLLRQSNRNYGLLEELGTRPRTTYLAKVVPKADQ